jgi:hypothetical protein
MFKVWFTNFGYFSVDECSALEGAHRVCRRAGFQAQVYSPDGNVVATFCPMAGWREV